MTGNVNEWCWDWYANYLKTPQIDPMGPSDPSYSSLRTFRGGGYVTLVNLSCEDRVSASVYQLNDYVGFRIVRPGPRDEDIGKTEEIVFGTYSAYSNPDTNISSSISYQLVDLPGENRIDVLKVVNPDGDSGWAVLLFNLNEYKNRKITIHFIAQVKRVGAAGDLNWQVNNSDYPSVGTPIYNAEAGIWHTMSGSWTGTPTDDDPWFYLSTWENNSPSTTYYVSNFTILVIHY